MSQRPCKSSPGTSGHDRNARQIPSSEHFFHYASVRRGGEIVAVVGHETLWTAELRRPPLLPHIVGVIAVRLIIGQIRQVLAPGVGGLHHESARELLAHGRLQAVVSGSTHEIRTSYAHSLVTEVRHAERHV